MINKIFSKTSNLFWLIIIITLTGFVFWLSQFGKLRKFPLEAEVWGTVSDWIMLLVTAITAYYLYQTLKSQQELTRIEHFRHREGLKPIFTLETTTVSENLSDTEKIFKLKFDIRCLENNAFNVDLSQTSYDPSYTFHINFLKKFMIKKDLNRILNVTYTSPNKESIFYIGRIKFVIIYSDADNNRYKQEMIFQMINTQHFKTVNLPEYIPKAL